MQAPTLASQYEKCPKHPANDIILFCLGGQCIEPLCKDCTKIHIHWHNQQGSKPDIDTVDNVRQSCLNDVHTIKVRFEEYHIDPNIYRERAILKHFSDSENSELVRTVHAKLEKVKAKLQQMINEYCASLENQIKTKLQQHKASHPGEKKDLHQRLNAIITNLDSQEKSITQQRYLRSLLEVLTEEKSHDLEGLASEIDGAVRHYLSNMFDVFVHEDKLDRIKIDLQTVVAVEEASLEGEIEIFTNKLRAGKQIYGVDKFGNPTNTLSKTQGKQRFPEQPWKALESSGKTPVPERNWRATALDPWAQNQSPSKPSNEKSQTRGYSDPYDSRETNNARLKSKYDL